jgi:hypothetical protein
MLYLSTSASPGLEPGDFLDGCARRGLAGVEVDAGTDPVAALERWCAPAAERGMRIAAVRVAGLAEAGDARLVAAAARLGVPVSAPADTAALDAVPLLDRAYACAGGSLLLAHGTDAAAAERLRVAAEAAGEGVGLAWCVRPGADSPELRAAALAAAGPRLRLVRLFGGGPEAQSQTGQGVGALIARLTLVRFAGPIVLTPSRAEYRTAWRQWIRAGRGWGCGSRTADPSLVTLGAVPAAEPNLENERNFA